MRKINALDAVVVCTILASAAGFGLAKAGFAGTDKIITKGPGKVAISIYFSGVKTLKTDIFEVGAGTNVTIRNRPVTPAMTITKVDHWQHKTSFLSPDGKSAVAFADPSIPIAHDYIVTVTDQAEGTDDGYVIRGNKVKIGNMVDLEGVNYRVTGVVCDISPVDGFTKGGAAPSTPPADSGANASSEAEPASGQ